MREFDHIGKLLHWMSGGALSASLAFIVFVPTLDQVSVEFQEYSMMCFIVAIPFLTISLYHHKVYELKQIDDDDQATSHISSAVAGSLFMVTGFLMLLAAIKLKYMYILFGAMFFMTLLEVWENSGKKKS